ncbi:Cytochrome P450, partial [Macrophomina phaseolina MS6]
MRTNSGTMAIHTVISSPNDLFDARVPHLLGAVLVMLTLLWYWIREERPIPGFPIANKVEGDWWFNSKAKNRLITDSNKILKEGFEKYKGKPFQILGEIGPMIVLSPELANEIRNNANLSFVHVTERAFLPQYKGLEPFGPGFNNNDIFQTTVRVNLTQSLGSITQAISDETTYALGILLPDVTKEWTSITWMPFATDLVSRISAKVFLGEPLCRNNDWLHISVMYTVNSFNAARTLRSWPPFLRPLVHLLKPEFKELQKQLADARRIINPEVEKRKRARREAIAAGQKPSKAADAIEWMLEQAKDQDYDVAMGQVMLAIAAIHTTSGMLSALLWHLAAAPEYIDELRKEIAQVFTEDGGFKKTSLYKMRLLDSCMKEAQRLHTISANALPRKALAPITLSDGTHIPAGAFVSVPTWTMRDSYYYENPDNFDGRRYLEKRSQPGNEHRWQFVTTAPEHLGFGHGQHA